VFSFAGFAGQYGSEYADDRQIHKWLKQYFYIILIIFGGELVPVFLVPFNLDPLLYIPLVNSVLFYLLVYKAVVNPEIFSKLALAGSLIEKTSKNKTFSLKESDINNVKINLDRMIFDKSVFFKSEMSLSYLSAELGIAEHHLTYVLNKVYNTNFKEFVNSIRVEEVKKRLIDADYNKLTIEAIGGSVGFASRITFHNVFKKHTNLTPADFKKMNAQ